MDALARSFTHYSGWILLALTALSLATGITLVALLASWGRSKRRWADLLRSTSGDNLEILLRDHLSERIRLERDLKTAQERIAHLEDLSMSSKRHLGLVRYDAFADVGGNQSFAMALYDDEGNGALINGLVGRADCRVYCKPLVGGKSERQLSQEEERAIREARDGSPKAIVSH